MTRDEWLVTARLLAQTHGDMSFTPSEIAGGYCGETGLVCLAELHKLVCAAPEDLHTVFRNCPEDRLSPGIQAKTDTLMDGRLGWAPRVEADASVWMIAAIEQVRALDEYLSLLPAMGLGPMSSPDQWKIKGADVFVIPRNKLQLDGPGPKAGEPYSRRGLLHHCILPARIGNLTVRPMHDASFIPAPRGPGDQLLCGAALFKSPSIKVRQVDGDLFRPKRFLVNGFESAGVAASLSGHVTSAFRDGCFAVVWPELTMPPASRAVARKKMAIEALSAGSKRPLAVAVGGSWHEQRAAGWFNIAEVYNRYAWLLLEHCKITPYWDQTNGEEAIESGQELAVLVTEHLVIGFAICKDFCDLAQATPYFDLPVDLVLIPSMGNVSTIEGHADNAKRLRLRNGTIVFVVQQIVPTQPRMLGYVLHSGDAAGRLRRADAKRPPDTQSGVWRVYGGARPAKQPRQNDETL